MKNFKLIESDLRKIVRLIIEENENETESDVVKILASDFLKIFRYTNSVDAILNTKKYKDSKVVIVGDLNFPSNDKVKTLGRLHGVEGKLDVSSLSSLQSLGELEFVMGAVDISNTKVSSVEGIEIDGYIRDSNTPLETKRLRKEFQSKLDEANERRESDVWKDVDYDDESAKAHALLEYIDNNESIDIWDEESKEEFDGLNRRLELLKDQYNETDDDDRIVELTSEIDEIESRIDEMAGLYYDVYDALPTGYNHYGGMTVFNFRDQGNLRNLKEYAVGTTDEADNALKEYYKNFIDDAGLESINQYIIENNIDGDSVADEFENYYEEEVRDNLDAYFNLDDLELSPEQESRKTDLESYIEELNEYIEEQQVIQSSLEDEIEEPDEYSERYDEIQELIDDAEKRRDDAQEEIDEMRGEVTDDMIQSEVEDKLYQIRRDPYDFLKDMGYDQKTILNFVDLDGVAEDLYQGGDYGDLNSYDGAYDEIKIGGDYYVVMRVN
jgi:hypothetical protein